MYFGDEHTDEDAFHELKGFKDGAGCGVIVSTVPKPSNAVFSVKDPAEVLTFLNSIADLAEAGTTQSMQTRPMKSRRGSTDVEKGKGD